MSDVWPPAPFDIAAARFREHDAWYSGDTATLNEIYSGQAGVATHLHDGKPYKGGVIGSLSKMWWGTPVVDGEKRSKMHIPVAADLCQLSADLLFAESPKIRFRKPEDAPAPKAGATKWEHPQQPRLDEIMASDETHAELLKAGEFAAALGGAYLAVVWNEKLSDRVRIRAYAADAAIPTFEDGILTSVQLWSEFRVGNEVYRLLESIYPGVIHYELHKGGEKNLGPIVPLSTLPETRHYDWLRTDAEMDAVAEDPSLYTDIVTVATGVPDKLSVVYFPNVMPQRDWRKLGVLANLGRSDLQGIEDLMDKVDQAWSSLLRDIELGKGRITVPESWLTTTGPGEGAKVDLDREVYSSVNQLGTAGSPEQATISQFEIRVEEHLQTIEALKREIASLCGYSVSHLGVKGTSTQQTATEVVADFTDSERTRDKKALYVKPALSRLAQVALAIDAVVFPGKGGALVEELPDIEFAPVSQIDPEKQARSIQLLDMARAASAKVRVQMAHPDWDDDEVDEEVALILAEQGTPAPDPATFTGDPLDPIEKTDQQHPATPSIKE